MVQPLEMYLQHFRNNHLLRLCRRCHLFLCDEPDRLRNLHPLINQTIYSQKTIVMSTIDSKIPEGPLAEKWTNYKAHQNW